MPNKPKLSTKSKQVATKKPGTRPGKTAKKNTNNGLKKYLRAVIVLVVAAAAAGVLSVFSIFAPKTETASTAPELITNLSNVAKVDNFTKPRLQYGLSMYRYQANGVTFKSAKDKTSIWLTTIPDSSYDSAKSAIDTYFTEHSYTKHDNGKSGAGASTNYDGNKFSCQVDDWGASYNGTTHINERTLLVACASVDDFTATTK